MEQGKMKFGNFAILGDSYSTFKGYIPEGHCPWYGPDMNEKNGVLTVEATWWYPIGAIEGNHLLFNDSYSGSTICNTSYEARYCPDTSFLGRMKVFEGHADDLDTLFVFAGTNDTWALSPLGEVTEKPYADYTDDELRCVLPATHCMLDYLRAKLPHTRIVLLLNDLLAPAIREALHRDGAAYGCDIVDLPAIAKDGGHPNATGMREIREAIFAFYAARESREGRV